MCASSCTVYTFAYSAMAKRAVSHQMLPSDPEYLLEYLDALPSDSSDDEFDGYLSEEANIDIADNDSEELRQPSTSERQRSMC